MGGRARVFRHRGRRLLGEVGGEALVEEDDGNVDRGAKRFREPFRRLRLLSALAAQRQRMADDDLLHVLVAGNGDDLVDVGAPNDTERARDDTGRVGDGHAGAGGPEVEREHLHAIAFFAAANAAGISPGTLPPACAIVGLPPPRPPTICPISFASAAASTPTLSATLTTMCTRPSVTEATMAPSAFSCWRIRSERSRSGPGWRSVVSASTTPSMRSLTVYPASTCGFGFSLRARSRSPRSSSASRARSRSSAYASPAVTASMRREPAPTELSPRTTNGPISAVERTCVPPHSSIDQPSMSTTRTMSPYFSPKSIIAPSSRASPSVVSKI